MMKISIEKIKVPERQRKEPKNIEGMAFSLARHGQIHPIVVEEKDGEYILIAGGRRLTAALKLGWVEIEATTRDALDPIARKELELEENLQREDLTWFEIASARAELHSLRQDQYGKAMPGRFSAGEGWGLKQTAEAVGISIGLMSQDIQLVEGIKKYPQLKDEKNKRMAMSKLKQLESLTNNEVKLSSELTQSIRESFINKPFLLSSKDIDKSTARLVVADLTNVPIRESLNEIGRILAIGGQGVVLFNFHQYATIVSHIANIGLTVSNDPYIWHVRGEDTFIPFLWISKDLANPPGSLRHHYSVNRDSPRGLPYSLCYKIVVFCTKRGDFVLEPFSHNPYMVQACMETNRNCTSYIESAPLYQECIEKVIESMTQLQAGLRTEAKLEEAAHE